MRIPILLTILLMTATSTPATADNKGWVVEQTRALSGRAVVYTSDRGRRFTNPKGNYELVSAPPDWSVFICNDRKKIYFPLVIGKDIKVKSASLGLLHGYILNNANDIKWSKIRSGRYLGHPVDVWRGFYDGSKIGTNGKSGAEFAYTVEFWVAADITLAPQIAAAYHVLLGWPDKVYNLPLRCIKFEKDGRRDTLLETQSLKSTDNSPDLFQLPKGYKLAQNEMNVLMNTDNMSEMLEGFGEMRDKSSAGKTAK